VAERARQALRQPDAPSRIERVFPLLKRRQRGIRTYFWSATQRRCAERAAARSGGCSRRSLIAFAGETAGGMGPDAGSAWGTPQARAFRDHSRKLAALEAKLFGLSAQPTDYRREMPCTAISSMFGGKA